MSILLTGAGPLNTLNARAAAFISVARITNATEITALNNLCNGIDNYNLSSKIKVLYPFVGGTSTSCSYNLMNTSQYQITWYGGMTFDYNGATGNGVNGYGDTNFNCRNLLFNSNYQANYIRNNITGANYVFGANTPGTYFFQNNIGVGNFISGEVSSIINYTANPSTKFLLSNRTSSTNFEAFRNNVFLGNNSNLVTGLPNLNYFLFARNDGSPVLYSPHNSALSSLGLGLTLTEVSIFNTLIDNFQITLGRNV